MLWIILAYVETPICTKGSYRHSLYFRNPGSPRVCGKDCFSPKCWALLLGSPPRVRERPITHHRGTVYIRITPACAGKTDLCAPGLNNFPDHPRVCGKDFGQKVSQTARLGSPPRVRERRCGHFKSYSWSRITPACAGKTIILPTCFSSLRDHPRVCGKD